MSQNIILLSDAKPAEDQAQDIVITRGAGDFIQ
jgi:hypothetical protein